MKKKFSVMLLCLAAIIQSASAQRLGVGLEVGTMGVGAELGVTIGNNLAVRGGFTFLPYTYKDKYEVELEQEWMNKMDEAIGNNQHIKDALSAAHLPTSSSELNTNLDLTAKSGLLNGKLLLDYYPWQSLSFHLTGGVYYGKDYLANATTELPSDTRQVIDILQKFRNETDFDFNDEQVLDGYNVRPLDIDGLEVKVETTKLKPYLGLGFGRAVPKNRIGFSFELGALFHGTPEITSSNAEVQRLIEDEIGDDVTNILEDLTVYPVLSIRLTGRILP